MNTLPLSSKSNSPSKFLRDLAPEEIGPLYTSIFERLGYFTTPAQGPASKAFDYILYKPDLSEPDIALRCRYDNRTVFADEISDFWKAINARGYTGGIFATNQSFGDGVAEFCCDKPLNLIDPDLLQAGVERLPDSHRNAILDRRWATPRSMNSISFHVATATLKSIPCIPSPISAAIGRLKREIASAPHLAYSLHRSIEMNPSIY